MLDNLPFKKGGGHTPLRTLLYLLPNLLLSTGALLLGILRIAGGAVPGPGPARAEILLLLSVFCLSTLSAILFWRLFRQSELYLSKLLREYGIIAQEERYALPELLTASGRERVFRTARAYTDSIHQLQFLRNQAEYTAHQSQIDPHFLYNTLDTIRGKALESGEDDIAGMIESLSRIFRYSISNKSDMFILQDELKNVKDYIKIQQIRFANRFSFQYAVDESDWRLMYFRVPKLILQPLVENAILHGLEAMVSGGVVSLFAYRTAQHVILRVSDNGQGMPPDRVKALCAALRDTQMPFSSGKGIALRNINQRIRHIFGPEYGLTFSSTEGYGTTVEIVMPYTEVQP